MTTETDAHDSDSAVPEIRSSCEHRQGMLFSFGINSETPALTNGQAVRRPESIVPRFAMRERLAAATSYGKRIELLMSSGLIAGITPTSTRKRLGADCLEDVSSLLVGDMYVSVVIERAPKPEDY